MSSVSFDNLLYLFVMSSINGVWKWAAMLMLMFAPQFKSKLEDLKHRIFGSRNKKLVIVQKCGKENQPVNFVYTAMSWYLTEKYILTQEVLMCEDAVSKRNELTVTQDGYHYFRKAPIYQPKSSAHFKYKGETIAVTVSIYQEEKQIILESKSNEIIRKFTDEVTHLFWESIYYTPDDGKVHIFQWEGKKNEKRFNSKVLELKKTFDNVYLKKDMIEDIQRDLQEFKNNREFYVEQGIPYKRGYLFYGCPGTGKSSTVFAIANELKRNIYKLNVKEFDEETFRKAINMIPPNSIVLIEEIDVHIYNDRTNTNHSSPSNYKNTEKKEDTKDSDSKKYDCFKKMAVSVLMDVMDGYECLYDCIIILTTNKKDDIEPALIRPGRIDVQYHFDEIGKSDIERVIKKFTGFKIRVPEGLKLPTSTLINQILLPNRRKKEFIENTLLDYLSVK